MRRVLVCLVMSTFCLASSHVRGQTPTAADLAWVPADVPGFVALRVADLWKHDSTKELRELLAKTQVDVEKEIEGGIGLRLSEIERVILIVPPPGKEPVFVVATTKPAGEKLLKAFSAPVSKLKHRDHTYYADERGGQALYAASERLFVRGPTKQVLELLDRAGERKADGPLSESLKLAADKAPFVACLNVAALGKDVKGTLPPQAEAALPLFDANPAILTIVSDADTRISARLTCASEQDAKTKAKVVLTALDILRQFIPIGRTELARDPTKDELNRWLFKQADTLLGDLENACKTAKAQAQGRVVHGELKLKANAGMMLTLGVGFFSSQRSAAPAEPAQPKKP